MDIDWAFLMMNFAYFWCTLMICEPQKRNKRELHCHEEAITRLIHQLVRWDWGWSCWWRIW
jgi:hypothetical protein